MVGEEPPDGPQPSPPEDQTTQETPSPRRIPTSIGQYRIVRRLGEGGMGIVYEAEQQHPRRPVALKVIRGGQYVDEHHVRLFHREAQALARLRHPGIAAIYESGRTDDGQHFFAMELVRGETLARHLQRRGKDGEVGPAEIRYRLNLFRPICDAVFYAHQRGVIHRDLKPSNVIVGKETAATSPEAPGAPEIKILDFGLARITDADVAVTTVHTSPGQVQGTIPYMSPEQIIGNPDEIDVRTDSYSLGVILYQMLTGHLPHDVTRLTLPEAARVICEEPPTPPSRVWKGARRLDPDLATIMGKAIEKEPARRYQSVSALAEDVQRYLANQPILARPPSALYQIRKVISRHKALFALTAALGVLLIGFSITMAVQTERIARERDRASQARDRASQEAETARQVSGFLTGLFEVSNPYRGKGETITAREILDRGAERIVRDLQAQPLVQARLMSTIGHVYMDLGLFSDAQRIYDQALTIRKGALGEDHADVGDSLAAAGSVRVQAGKLDEGLESLRRGLEIQERTLSPDHLDIGTTLLALGEGLGRKGDIEGARAALERALPILERGLGPGSSSVARCLNNLGNVHYFAGRYADAAAYYERSLRIKENLSGPESAEIAVGLNNLGFLYLTMGDHQRAGPILERSLTISQKTFGAEHSKTASHTHSLGELRRLEGRHLDARPLLERALAIQEKTLDPKDPDLALTLHSLAQTLLALGDRKGAEACFKRCLEIREKALGPDHADVAETLEAYARLLREMGRGSQAEPLEARARSIRDRAAAVSPSGER